VGDQTQVRLAPDEIDKLIRALARDGYEVLGPTVRDGAIVYDEIEGAKDLPRGWTDEQEAGRYRLKPRADGALFAYSVGPQSWKKALHPAHVRLFAADQKDGVFHILDAPASHSKPYAFLGVRACEQAAIAIQDRVLLNDKYRDPVYAARRTGAFLIAVQCTQSAATCFCSSMGTGPAAPGNADVTLTEMVDGDAHWFHAQAGSARGQKVLGTLASRPATDEERAQVRVAVEAAAAQQVRRMETADVREMLGRNFEHSQWDDIAARCLSCANCTMVCPTCFCTDVEDVSDVTGNHAERWRRWDSCFSIRFSYIHGGSVRTTSKSRYRQWLTHKLSAWVDQFGSTGCVGCGRCITWCPAGIDLTEEIQAFGGVQNNGNTDA
jgi:sulfhydrogenase subunit beta (sulfur reductase)